MPWDISPSQRVTMGLEPHHWLDLARLAGFVAFQRYGLLSNSSPKYVVSNTPAQAPPLSQHLAPLDAQLMAFYTAHWQFGGSLLWHLSPLFVPDPRRTFYSDFCLATGPRIVRGTHGGDGRGGARPDVLPRAGTPRDTRRCPCPRAVCKWASPRCSGCLWAHCAARKPVLEWHWTVDLCPVHPPIFCPVCTTSPNFFPDSATLCRVNVTQTPDNP